MAAGGAKPENTAQKKSAMKKIKSVEPEKICAVKFLFNPKSFTQTVENVFAMSFMVRKGQAAIGVRTVEDCKNACIDSMKPKPGPWIRNKKDKDENVAVEHRQSIVSLNMQVSIFSSYFESFLFEITSTFPNLNHSHSILVTKGLERYVCSVCSFRRGSSAQNWVCTQEIKLEKRLHQYMYT